MSDIKDWIQDAAEEIYHGGEHGEHRDVSPEVIASVIRKHSPFDPQYVYARTDDVIETIRKALSNSGVDVTCGACMEVAFTGVTTNAHTCMKSAPGTWAEKAARAVLFQFDLSHVAPTNLSVPRLAALIEEQAQEEWNELLRAAHKEPPLLQCIDCKNTESCAGAMARAFNHGRCMHCGGYFKVVRA